MFLLPIAPESCSFVGVFISIRCWFRVHIFNNKASNVSPKQVIKIIKSSFVCLAHTGPLVHYLGPFGFGFATNISRLLKNWKRSPTRTEKMLAFYSNIRNICSCTIWVWHRFHCNVKWFLLRCFAIVAFQTASRSKYTFKLLHNSKH